MLWYALWGHHNQHLYLQWQGEHRHPDVSSSLTATAHGVSASEAHRLFLRHGLLTKSAIFQQFWKVLAGLAAESQALRPAVRQLPGPALPQFPTWT